MPALDSLISALLQTAAPRSPLLLREWQSRQLAEVLGQRRQLILVETQPLQSHGLATPSTDSVRDPTPVDP